MPYLADKVFDMLYHLLNLGVHSSDDINNDENQAEDVDIIAKIL
jgi:hypothetical protein